MANALADNRLRQKHQSYDEEMLSGWQPRDATPQWLQNTLNVPYNALAQAANVGLTADTAKEWAAHYVGKSPQFAYDLVTGLPNVLAQGYEAGKSHMTGGIPLVTGEPGRPHTDADTYKGAAGSIDALGAASLFSLAAPARAAALGARTRPAAGFSVADLPAAEVKKSPPHIFRPERVRKNGTVVSPRGGTLFSNTKQASPASVFTAYHGSPHDFDKFSMDSIGTGEGAQAYGHGLYFAEAEDVAKNYRNELSSGRMADGSQFDNSNPAHVASSYVDDYGRDSAALEIDKMRNRLRTAIARGGEDPTSTNRRQGELSVLDRAKEVIDRGDKLPATTKGHMYEVQINANKDDFLDWDNRLVDQPKVREKLERHVDDIKKAGLEDIYSDFIDGVAMHGMSGQDLSTIAGKDPTAFSRELKSIGIPGIRYLDGDSRGVGKGSSNYVLFDADLAEIKRKYAQAGIPLPPEYREMERETPKQPGIVIDGQQISAPEQTFDGWEQF